MKVEQRWIRYDRIFSLIIATISLVYLLNIPFLFIQEYIGWVEVTYYSIIFSLAIIILLINHRWRKGMVYSIFKSGNAKSIIVKIEKILNDQNIQFQEIQDTNTILIRLLSIRLAKSFRIVNLSFYIRIWKESSNGTTVDIGPVNSANESITELIKSQLL